MERRVGVGPLPRPARRIEANPNWMPVSLVQGFSKGHTMLDHELLETKFARIGARLKGSDGRDRRRRISSGALVTLDIQRDRKGEYFEVIGRPDTEAEVEVLDVQSADRHLLLLVREGGRSTSSSAATTSGTGSSPLYPSRPRSARFGREGGAQARRGPVRPGPKGAGCRGR